MRAGNVEVVCRSHAGAYAWSKYHVFLFKAIKTMVCLERVVQGDRAAIAPLRRSGHALRHNRRPVNMSAALARRRIPPLFFADFSTKE